MELNERLHEFLRQNYYNELMRASTEEKPFIAIDFSDLDRFDPVIADRLLEEPESVLTAFSSAIDIFDLPVEEKINVRIRNLPERRSIRIRSLRSEHINKFWCVDAVVKAASEVKPQISEAVFQCPECGSKIIVPQDGLLVQKPFACECGRRGDFPLVDKKMIDVRWLTGVEPFEIASGEQPGQVAVFLRDDLTTPRMQRKTDPGARLRIIGILKELPKRIKGKLTTKMDMYIEANYAEPAEIEFEELEISEEDEQRIIELSKDPNIFERLKASIAPGIYGIDEIKEALALQLFGGVPHYLPDNSRIRGNIHILLTGDPGVGKTVLLKLASSVMPRGKYVSGSGVSGVGLCTTYDTLITLGDGRIKKIGDLVEDKIKNEKEIEKDIFISDGDLDILAFDQKNLKIKPMKIAKYWKLKSPKKLTEITTRTGKKIKITPDNPIPIIKNGEIIWKSAKDAGKGEYIASPRVIENATNCEGDYSIFNFIDKTARLVNCKHITPLLIEKIKKYGTIRDFAKNLGVDENSLYHDWRGVKAPTLNMLIKISEKVGLDLESHLPDELVLMQYMGHKIKLPKKFTEDLMYFFGLIAGDGNICKSKHGGLSLRFSSNDEEMLNKFSWLCENLFGLTPEYYKHPERIPYLRINSKIIGGVAEKIGILNGKKSDKLRITEELSKLPNNLISAYLKGLFDTDGYVAIQKKRGSNYVGIDTASKEFALGLHLLMLRFGIISKLRARKPTISIIKGRDVISKEKYSIEIRGLRNLKIFEEKIGFGFAEKSKKLRNVIIKISKDNPNVDVIPEIASLIREARIQSGLSAKELYGYKNYSWEKRIKISRKALRNLIEKMKKHGENQLLKKLENFAYSDIFWDEVVDVKTIDGEDYVYDVTVEDGHSFVANGLIIHNTATVRKDEILGGWVLEAGALILCNKGLISIDEFDKISRDDQIAMHEAMSVETVSIAKASIVATLPAETAVLGGANPKLGRFDPIRPITDQLDIPETLLSRFDLKFALRDVPDRSKDERLAEHITIARISPEVVAPEINVNLLRKYIAYAKRINQIELTKEASEILKNFYVDMRNLPGTEEVTVVSITLRQYEALLRLAEASAKVRLSNKITVEDAERAIRLMKYSLLQLGFDYETGRYDIDKLESGITATQRSRIRVILDIIETLQREFKEASVDDVMAEAETQGIEKADEVIDRLKREGIIFEPRPGFVKKI